MSAQHTPGPKPLRTWGDDKRCAECCSGDRCDDPSHYDRSRCPHCKSTGWALWTEAGREDYVRYLQGWRGMSEQQARAVIAKATGSTTGFAKDDRVIYVPNHADGDTKHPDCERGIVSSTNDVNVFVRYYNKHGQLAHTAQATRPEDLHKAAGGAS